MSARPRILVVDDDALTRTQYADVLRDAGHLVDVAATGEEGLARAEAQPPDIVITDLLLPGLDGLALLRELKRRHGEVEVVVVTALERVEPAVRALQDGAADYLVKPLRPELLTAAVDRCLLTRQLLSENRQLRAHVSLLEAAHRITRAADADALARVLLEAAQRQTQPAAAAVLLFRTGGWSVRGALRLDEAEEATLLATLRPMPPGAMSPGESVAVGARRAQLWPLGESPDPVGVLVVVEPQSIDDPARSGLSFLASHAALALRTHARLAEVEDLAYLDATTGLYNARFLELHLERAIEAAQAGGRPFSVLFLDIDHFKRVNDTHGHLKGSELLKQMAHVLREALRDGDVVTRYGGDEFVVVLAGLDSRRALPVAERLRATLERHPFLAEAGPPLAVTVSIGVAGCPEHGLDRVAILAMADRALYAGKGSTRNTVFLAHPDGPRPAPLSRGESAD